MLIVMPVISSFFGIYIRMYHDDHPPPHIHAEYQGHESLVCINEDTVLNGYIQKLIPRNWKEKFGVNPLTSDHPKRCNHLKNSRELNR
ncbi:DUF4160 domain-containing protein [Endozoicomonas sp. 8E]|uniref:DUF4160 domain-containing protein n=1 Tax=Endozoicomonas sp. 8E TaxID=3035692 RepID=UPI0039776630